MWVTVCLVEHACGQSQATCMTVQSCAGYKPVREEREGMWGQVCSVCTARGMGGQRECMCVCVPAHSPGVHTEVCCAPLAQEAWLPETVSARTLGSEHAPSRRAPGCPRRSLLKVAPNRGPVLTRDC